MCASSIDENATILLNADWSDYERLLKAFGDEMPRHTYADGVLELLKNPIPNVSWEAYSKLIDIFGDRRVPHTYQMGMFEMMSPSSEHEWIARFLGRLVGMMSLELNIPIRSAGATTQ